MHFDVLFVNYTVTTVVANISKVYTDGSGYLLVQADKSLYNYYVNLRGDIKKF